jgi:hypothetical protein
MGLRRISVVVGLVAGGCEGGGTEAVVPTGPTIGSLSGGEMCGSIRPFVVFLGW